MGTWGWKAWEDDEAADWLGSVLTPRLSADVLKSLKSPSNRRIAAAWVVHQVGLTYAWPIEDLHRSLLRASHALEDITASSPSLRRMKSGLRKRVAASRKALVPKGPSARDEAQLERLQSKALAARARREYDLACEVARKAVELDLDYEGRVRALELLGLCAWTDRDMGIAAIAYRRAVNGLPQKSMIHDDWRRNTLGTLVAVFSSAGRLDVADRVLKQRESCGVGDARRLAFLRLCLAWSRNDLAAAAAGLASIIPAKPVHYLDAAYMFEAATLALEQGGLPRAETLCKTFRSVHGLIAEPFPRHQATSLAGPAAGFDAIEACTNARRGRSLDDRRLRAIERTARAVGPPFFNAIVMLLAEARLAAGDADEATRLLEVLSGARAAPRSVRATSSWLRTSRGRGAIARLRLHGSATRSPKAKTAGRVEPRIGCATSA